MGDFGLNQTFEYSELALDSWDATTSGDTTARPNTILDKYSWPFYYFTTKQDSVAGIKIISAEIPNVFFPINSSNNVFTFTVTGVPFTLTIPVINYTATTLATAVATLLNSVSSGFSVAYSTTTLRYTITSSLALTWSLFFNGRHSPCKSLGFLPSTLYSASGPGSSIVSQLVAQPLGPSYLYLNSQKLGPLINFNQADAGSFGGSGNPQIARIPINASFGNKIIYNDPGIYLLTRPSKIF